MTCRGSYHLRLVSFVTNVPAFFLFLFSFDYSRYTWLILMKSKGETRNRVQSFLNMIENQFESKVKIVRIDNGSKFSMSQFFASKGIIHQTSCVETPQQKARVERKHQHILNIARALLFQSNFYLNNFGVILLFVVNRVSSPILENKSPFFLIHHKS
jgi:hypothetical protein